MVTISKPIRKPKKPNSLRVKAQGKRSAVSRSNKIKRIEMEK
jgi:hypothetical protein